MYSVTVKLFHVLVHLFQVYIFNSFEPINIFSLTLKKFMFIV